MKTLRTIGSLAFVLGLFTVVFIGVPWHVIVADDPVVPWWLRTAIFCLLGGILVVLLTLALEQKMSRKPTEEPLAAESDSSILLLNSTEVPGRRTSIHRDDGKGSRSSDEQDDRECRPDASGRNH